MLTNIKCRGHLKCDALDFLVLSKFRYGYKTKESSTSLYGTVQCAGFMERKQNKILTILLSLLCHHITLRLTDMLFLY